jgi:hypothetical protein
MSNEKKYERQYEGLMAMYEATQETVYLVQAYKMWSDKKIIVKDVDHYFEVPTFYKANKFGKTCSRCSCQLNTDPVFGIKDRVLNKNKYWCVACASPEDRTNTFYQNWFKAAMPAQAAPSLQDWSSEQDGEDQ